MKHSSINPGHEALSPSSGSGPDDRIEGPPLERFARLSARLADPFADRARLLAAYGFDEASWRGLQVQWETEIGARLLVGDGVLATAYSEAFTRESAHLREARSSATTSTMEAPPTPPENVDMTMAPVIAPGPALPFAGERAAPPPSRLVDPGRRGAEEDDDAEGVDRTHLLIEVPSIGSPLPFKN